VDAIKQQSEAVSCKRNYNFPLADRVAN